MKLRYYLFLLSVVLTVSCNSDKNKIHEPLADSGRTQRTENLLENLILQGDSGVYMFGHHDDTVYGIGWEADYTNDSTVSLRSDVKSVCGDLPAVLSLILDILNWEMIRISMACHSNVLGKRRSIILIMVV